MAGEFDSISEALKKAFYPQVIARLMQPQSPLSRFLRMSRREKLRFERTVRVEATVSTLTLDLDTSEQVNQFTIMLGWFMQSHQVNRVLIWPSSGDGVHAVVACSKPVDNPIGWQMILGSDPWREWLNAMDMREGDSYSEANVLFKPLRCKNCHEGYLSWKFPEKCMWCSGTEA